MSAPLLLCQFILLATVLLLINEVVKLVLIGAHDLKFWLFLARKKKLRS